MKILLAIDGSKFSAAAVEACKKYIESGMATEVAIVGAAPAAVMRTVLGLCRLTRFRDSRGPHINTCKSAITQTSFTDD